MEEDKRSASMSEYMYVYNHPPSSTGISHFDMKSALVCGSIQRTGLFVPLSTLVIYSQTPGLFAEPLLPFSHIPQIKITYLALIGSHVCSGAPLYDLHYLKPLIPGVVCIYIDTFQ